MPYVYTYVWCLDGLVVVVVLLVPLRGRFRTLREANFDLMKLCEEHDTSYERGRSEMQQYRYRYCFVRV